MCAGWAQVRSTVVATRFAWIGTLYRPYPGQIIAWFGFVGDVWPLLVLFVHVGRCFEALSKLFSGGPLSLRADHRRSQNYWDFDSRLNLVHLFAASGWCGLG